MDCKTASDLMMKYLDEEISKEEEKLLYDHLDFCMDCSLEFEALKDTFALIDDIEFEEPPKGLEQSVITRIQAEKVRVSKVRVRNIVIAAFLAMLGGWLGLTLLFQNIPVISIMVKGLSGLAFMADGLSEFLNKAWYLGLAFGAKLIIVSRAMGVVGRTIVEMYNLLILAMIILLALILRIYGYMYKIVRR